MVNAVKLVIFQTLTPTTVSLAKNLAKIANRLLPHARFAKKEASLTNRLANRV